MTEQPHAEPLPTTIVPARAFDRFVDWLYMPPAYLPLVRRLTGAATIAIGFIVYIWSQGGPGPYVVPSWRFIDKLFVPPLPPPLVTNGIFLAATLACIWLALGTRRKWVIAIPVLVGAYFGCRDYWAMGSHFIVMLWTYLVALLFDAPTNSRGTSNAAVAGTSASTNISASTDASASSNTSASTDVSASTDTSASTGMPSTHGNAHPSGIARSLRSAIIDPSQSTYSVSRRLIQLSVFFCYFYSAVQKLLCPDFMSGFSIQAEMADGWSFNDFWKPILHLQYVPHWFWLSFSWVTVVLEFFLAFGLFSKRWRKWAFLLGIGFHIGISVLLDLYITLFSVAMLIGYLAFLDPPRPKEAASAPAPQPEKRRYARRGLVGACAFIALMALVPLRIYFFQTRPLAETTMFDRTPWTFCMFLQRIDQNKVNIIFKEHGAWQALTLNPKWRTKSASTDTEMYSICNWLFHSRPAVDEVVVELEFAVNRQWTEKKRLHATREHVGEITTIARRPETQTQTGTARLSTTAPQ